MSKLLSIPLFAGLVCACAATAPSFAADPAQNPVANVSSAEFPWIPTNGEFLPPAGGLGPITYDKAHPHIVPTPNNRGDIVQRPLALADVSNPNLKPWVVEYLKKANEDLLAGKLRYASRASCMPSGVPMFLIYGAGFQPIYFIQTRSKVLMINSGDTQVRRVYLNVSHSEHLKPSWYGESVGHYDGDELVVDTIGFNDRTFLDDSYNVPHTTQLHVTERFKPSEDGKMLQVSFTVDDPGAFNAPWSGIVRYRRAASAGRLTEQPCAENNRDASGNQYSTPIATKADF
jgi:hypothetical protein